MAVAERHQESDSQAPDIRSLRQIPLLQSLDEEYLVRMAAVLRRRTLRAGELIMGVEAEDAVFVIHSGRARLYRLSRDGHGITLANLNDGDIFGLVFPGPDENAKSAVEILLDGTIVYRIPRDHFQRLIASHPDSAKYVLTCMSRRLADAYERIEDLALHDGKTRLAHVLAQLAAADDLQMVWATHDELAQMVGTTRERVTKLLCHLRQSRLVAYEPHQRGISVLDLPRLAEAPVDPTARNGTGRKSR